MLKSDELKYIVTLNCEFVHQMSAADENRYVKLFTTLFAAKQKNAATKRHYQETADARRGNSLTLKQS